MRRVLAVAGLCVPLGCGAATGLDVGGPRADAAPDAETDAGHDAGFDGGHDAAFDSGHDTGFDSGRDVGIDTGTDAASTTCGYRAPGMPGISQATCAQGSACVPVEGCVDVAPAADQPTTPCGDCTGG